MKRYILLAVICMSFGSHIKAQDYKVVFDMTSADSVNQQALVRQLTYIKESNPAAQMEVVIYGQGLNLITKNKTSLESAVSRLIEKDGVSFKVCAATMKRYNATKTDLVTGVEVVPDGIFEIIQKQREGWGYIKVAH